MKDNIKTSFEFNKRIKIVLAIFIAIGLISLAYGIFSYPPERVWAVLAHNSINFLTIALGAAFFIAFNIIAQSGWHVSIQRIPEAMSMFIVLGSVLMLVLLLGVNHIFHWTHEIHHDPIVEGKKAYLNIPFFIIRLVVFLVIWIVLINTLRKLSKKSDETEGLKHYNKSRTVAALFIVFFALSIVVFAWDWLMSIEAHWFSTLYGWYVLSGAIVKSFAVMIILLFFLRRMGYFEFVTKENIHDLARYLFSFSIFWMYLWFSQFMLIWYANIPEETVYFIKRMENYTFLFYLNLVLNFLIPFLILIVRQFRRILWVVTVTAVIVFAGQWLDQYLMIFPGIFKKVQHIGFFDIGLTIGYTGVFLWMVFYSLSKAELLPKNHPYLKESFSYENI